MWDAGFQRECGAVGGGWREALPPSWVAELACHRLAHATEAGKLGQHLPSLKRGNVKWSLVQAAWKH